MSNCPYNIFRTTADITNSWDSMYGNLQVRVHCGCARVVRVLCACSVYGSLIVPVRESALECVRARVCVLCLGACVTVLVRSVCSFRVSARACMGVRACICMRVRACVRACVCVRVRMRV